MLLDRDEENIKKVKEIAEFVVENGDLLNGSKSYFVTKIVKDGQANFRVDYYEKDNLYKVMCELGEKSNFFAMYSEGEMYKREHWYQLHEVHGILFSNKYPTVALTI